MTGSESSHMSSILNYHHYFKTGQQQHWDRSSQVRTTFWRTGAQSACLLCFILSGWGAPSAQAWWSVLPRRSATTVQRRVSFSCLRCVTSSPLLILRFEPRRSSRWPAAADKDAASASPPAPLIISARPHPVPEWPRLWRMSPRISR